ncbi:MAG: helix-turn-helix transcriptional regulator, partial [candidate division Zixibacteria bacterium]|nr:helix-turn-helix transcriptional regulator [candidate division Zixibacteria bacterium]
MTGRSRNPTDDSIYEVVIPRVQDTEAVREKRRKQIIRAAETEFARKGYYNTDVASIAERAGVSKGTIYNYFDNKEALLMGV